jgi:hypothetical protein
MAIMPTTNFFTVSSDQYGNYLIQYILTHANAQHREVVASHIRYVMLLHASNILNSLTFI